MNYIDIIGTIGVGLILLAYFFHTSGWINGRGKFFFVEYCWSRACLLCFLADQLLAVCDTGRNMVPCFCHGFDQKL